MKELIKSTLSDNLMFNDIAKVNATSIRIVKEQFNYGINLELTKHHDVEVAKLVTIENLLSDISYYMNLKKVQEANNLTELVIKRLK